MKFFRKQPPSTERRQRIINEPGTTPTFSYHTHRSEITGNIGRQELQDVKASAVKKPPVRWFMRGRSLLVLIGLIILAWFVLGLSTTPRIVIQKTQGDNTFLEPTVVYEQAAHKLLARSLLNHNKITLNTSAIVRALEGSFPGLSSVSITTSWLSRQPTIYLQPAVPSILFEGSNGTYMLDNEGRALRALPANTNLHSLELPIVINQGSQQVVLQHQILTSNNVSFIQTIVFELAARHFTVTNFTIPAGTSELDATLAGQSYIVKFNLESNDARQQAGTFLAAQANLVQSHISPSAYIDVRVDGRAYYK